MNVQQWSWKGWAVGVMCGLGLAILVGAETTTTRSTGEERYQLGVWAHAGSQPGDVGKHGAYRLDTQTGEVWSISVRDEAKKIDFK